MQPNPELNRYVKAVDWAMRHVVAFYDVLWQRRAASRVYTEIHTVVRSLDFYSYECWRSSGDQWSRPGANDVLWLFRKWDHWVAGHADKETKQIQDVLDKARLIWSTSALCPWLVGVYDWRWVDNDASALGHTVIAPWFCGTLDTQILCPSLGARPFSP